MLAEEHRDQWKVIHSSSSYVAVSMNVYLYLEECVLSAEKTAKSADIVNINLFLEFLPECIMGGLRAGKKKIVHIHREEKVSGRKMEKAGMIWNGFSSQSLDNGGEMPFPMSTGLWMSVECSFEQAHRLMILAVPGAI